MGYNFFILVTVSIFRFGRGIAVTFGYYCSSVFLHSWWRVFVFFWWGGGVGYIFMVVGSNYNTVDLQCTTRTFVFLLQFATTVCILRKTQIFFQDPAWAGPLPLETSWEQYQFSFRVVRRIAVSCRIILPISAESVTEVVKISLFRQKI